MEEGDDTSNAKSCAWAFVGNVTLLPNFAQARRTLFTAKLIPSKLVREDIYTITNGPLQIHIGGDRSAFPGTQYPNSPRWYIRVDGAPLLWRTVGGDHGLTSAEPGRAQNWVWSCVGSSRIVLHGTTRFTRASQDSNPRGSSASCEGFRAAAISRIDRSDEKGAESRICRSRRLVRASLSTLANQNIARH